MKSYIRFNLFLLIATLSSILGIGIINLVIDPYGVTDNPKISFLNRLKPKQIKHVRLFKAINVNRIKPKTVFLGSSRVDLGLDPSHPALEKLQPAYNLALVGPNMYEVRRYFEHLLVNPNHPKTIVLGIDFFMFNKYKNNAGDFEESRLGRQSINNEDFVNTALSIDALNSSIETIQFNMQPGSSSLYQENGMRYLHLPPAGTSTESKFHKMTNRLLNTRGYYQEYLISQEYLADFQQIVVLCREKNIDLKVFISPMHASLIDGIREAGLWSDFENWKREITTITPVWDFSGYNSITTEPIGQDMKNYLDSSHYSSKVGDLILNRLFNYQEETIATDFGILITSENIGSHLAQVLVDQALWSDKNTRRAEVTQF